MTDSIRRNERIRAWLAAAPEDDDTPIILLDPKGGADAWDGLDDVTVADLRGLLAEADEIGETHVEWGADHGGLGILYSSRDEDGVRLHCKRNGREIRHRVVGQWQEEM